MNKQNYFFVGSLLCWMILSANWFFGEEAAVAGQRIKVNTGGSTAVAVNSLVRVFIDNPAVADVTLFPQDEPREVRILGVSTGKTSLTIWDNKGKVTYEVMVLFRKPTEIEQNLRQVLSKEIIDRIQIEAVEDKIILSGNVDTEPDFVQLKEAIYQYKDQVINRVKVWDKYWETTIGWVKKMIGVESVDLIPIGDKILLDGFVPTAEDIIRAEKIALMKFPNVINTLKVNSRELIQLDIKIYEVNTDFSMDIDWNLLKQPVVASVSGNVLYKIFENAKGGEVSGDGSLATALRMAIDKGKGRLLAEPSIVVVNGGTAKFNVGGEIGVNAISATGAGNVEWKSFGTRVVAEPLMDKFGNIMLKVITEVSEPDWAHSVGGVPPVSGRVVETNTYIRRGETLLIAGLLKETEGKTVTRFPILGYIPILDLFLKTTQTTKIQKELFIFITPTNTTSRVLSAVQLDIQKMRGKGYQLLEKGEFKKGLKEIKEVKDTWGK